MSKYIKLGSLVLILVLVLGIGIGKGWDFPNSFMETTEDYGKLCKPIPNWMPKFNKHHQLKDWSQYDDSLKQFQEMYHMYRSTEYYLDSKVPNLHIDSISCSWNIMGRDYKVIFQDYVKHGDKIWYYAPGRDPEKLYPHQFKIVVNDLYHSIKEAMKENNQLLQEMKPNILNSVANSLDISTGKLKEQLDDVVIDYTDPPMTLRELLNIPNLKGDKNDTLLIYGIIPKPLYGASTVWTYGGSRIVFYHTAARYHDYIRGDPLVLKHELWHANGTQFIPLNWYYDVELFTEMLTSMTKDNPLNVMYSGYLKPVDQLINVAFNFDLKKVNHQMIKNIIAGEAFIDRQKFRHYIDKINVIIDELRHTIKDVMIPAFYSDQLFWTTLNTLFCDDTTMFWVIMSQVYEPTNLDDPQYTREELTNMTPQERREQAYQYTTKWIDENWDLIKEASEEALDQAGERTDTGEDTVYSGEFEGYSWCPMSGRSVPARQMKAVKKLLQDYSLREAIIKFLSNGGEITNE